MTLVVGHVIPIRAWNTYRSLLCVLGNVLAYIVLSVPIHTRIYTQPLLYTIWCCYHVIVMCLQIVMRVVLDTIIRDNLEAANLL